MARCPSLSFIAYLSVSVDGAIQSIAFTLISNLVHRSFESGRPRQITDMGTASKLQETGQRFGLSKQSSVKVVIVDGGQQPPHSW